MKLLWHSVAPWVGTGYGQQTATFTPRIKALGHDLAISVYYGLAGQRRMWHGIVCYPQYAEPYGRDTIIPHAVHHFGGGKGAELRKITNDGVIITLGDVWTFQQPLLADFHVAAWTPVDHETLPAQVHAWFEMTGAHPIAMSRFGERLLADAGLRPLYVPHGVDTAVFRPGDKAEARERAGLPQDAFVVAIVAANIGRDGNRKAFFEQILAFGQLLRKHSDTVLALHTDVTSPVGVDILRLLSDFPETSYLITDQYLYRIGQPSEMVADIYRAADVLSNTSWGEGFGLPIVESQACGTPVVVTDTTAMPELVGAGWKVPGELLWHDSTLAWARRPLVGGIVDAYLEAYEHARDDELRARAWAFAQDYDADVVTERYWVPALATLEEALERRRDAAAKPAKPVERIREADGLVWLERQGRPGDVLGFADHEAANRPILEGLLPEGGVLLDVGAHVGHWTLRLARKASRVVAVEANPDTAATLRRHLAMNGITNVQVVQMAAWDSWTHLRLDDPAGQVEGGSTRTVPSVNGEVGTVPAGRLDQIPELADIGRLDLVKLDVEGADLHALRGMAGLLERYRPVLFIEDHSVYGYFKRADLEATLTDLGYGFEVAHSVPTQWMPDGPSDVVRMADYLVCTPAVVGATKE